MPGGTLALGNLQWLPNHDQVHWCRAVDGHATGKYYFESVNDVADGQFKFGTLAGVMKATTVPVDIQATGFVGSGVADGCYVNGTQLFNAGSSVHGAFAGWAIDVGAMKAWVHFHVVSPGSLLFPWNNDAGADPATGVGGIDMTPFFPFGTTLFPYVQGGSFANVVSQLANFGGSAFNMSVPSGFTPGWPAAPAAATPQASVWCST